MLLKKISNQTCIILSYHLVNASAILHYLIKHENRILSLKRSITTLPDFNQSLLHSFNFAGLHFICCTIL